MSPTVNDGLVNECCASSHPVPSTAKPKDRESPAAWHIHTQQDFSKRATIWTDARFRLRTTDRRRPDGVGGAIIAGNEVRMPVFVPGKPHRRLSLHCLCRCRGSSVSPLMPLCPMRGPARTSFGLRTFLSGMSRHKVWHKTVKFATTCVQPELPTLGAYGYPEPEMIAWLSCQATFASRTAVRRLLVFDDDVVKVEMIEERPRRFRVESEAPSSATPCPYFPHFTSLFSPRSVSLPSHCRRYGSLLRPFVSLSGSLTPLAMLTGSFDACPTTHPELERQPSILNDKAVCVMT